jgi:hypothetical protein
LREEAAAVRTAVVDDIQHLARGAPNGTNGFTLEQKWRNLKMAAPYPEERLTHLLIEESLLLSILQ